MAKRIRRMLAILLVLCVFVSATPLQALAAEADEDDTQTTTETVTEDGLTTDITTTTTTTTDENGNVTVVVVIEQNTEGTKESTGEEVNTTETTTTTTQTTTDAEGNVTKEETVVDTMDGTVGDKTVEHDQTSTSTTVTDSEGNEISSSWNVENSETQTWEEEIPETQSGMPEVEVELIPGGDPTTASKESDPETVLTDGEKPESEDENNYDYTETTTTIDRTVTAETSDIEVNTKVDEGQVEEQDTKLEGLIPEIDVIDGVAEDKKGMREDKTGHDAFMEIEDKYADPSTWKDIPEGADVRLLGYAEGNKYYMSRVIVTYKKDENGNTVYDENGDPVIESIKTHKGTTVTLKTTGEAATELLPGTEYANGTTTRAYGNMILMDKDGNMMTAYCCDADIEDFPGKWYTVTNLEDSGYYVSEESEEHIRNIAMNGYWGTSDIPKADGSYEFGSLESIKQKIIDDIQSGKISSTYMMTVYDKNGNTSLDEDGNVLREEIDILDYIDGLTEGEAMMATQAAIWSYSNGSIAAQNGQDGYVIVGADSATNHNHSKNASFFKDDYLDNYGGARLEFVYNWLMNLDTNDQSTVVINDQHFLEGFSLTVGDKVGEVEDTDADGNAVTNGIYETALNFTLAFAPTAKDELLVCLKYIDMDGQEVAVTKRLAIKDDETATDDDLTPNDDGVYTFKNLKLSENRKFDFDLRLEGTQYLERGVYLYSSVGGREDSQTMIGVAEGERSVDVSAGISISFNVEEKKTVKVEHHLSNQGENTADETDPPENDPPENDPPENDPPENDPPENDPPENDPPEEEEEDDDDGYRLARDDGELEDIPDEEVPLAAAPKTGDVSPMLIAMIVIACFGLVALNVTDKKRNHTTF